MYTFIRLSTVNKCNEKYENMKRYKNKREKKNIKQLLLYDSIIKMFIYKLSYYVHRHIKFNIE